MRSAILSRRRLGFTLIEMVTVMAALSAAVLLGSATLLGAMKFQRAATDSLRRQMARSVLADEFRADVATAVAAPDRLDNLTAGPACLILRMAESRYVAYRWNEDQLERAEMAGPGSAPKWLPRTAECQSAEFSRSGTEGRVVHLRLSESQKTGKGMRVREFIAALGGESK